jgi:hypothetical protein
MNGTTEETVRRVLSESVLTIPQARIDILNATGIKPDTATICRWILRGRKGVTLEAVKVGNQWITSIESLNRFIIATTEKALKSD